MLFSPLAWAMLTLTLLVAVPGALAAPMAKRGKKAASKKVVPEVYPALEDGEIETPREEIVQTTKIEVSRPVKRVARTERPLTMRKANPAPAAAPAVVGVEAPIRTSQAHAEPIRKFEEVPSEKREQILKRMELCETLLKVSGRAYDYRTMTTAQLETELAALQPNVRQRAAAIAVEPAGEVPVLDPILNPDLEPIIDN